MAKIDQMGKYGWITAVVLAFWFAWPIGLMLVAYLAGSGRLTAMRAEHAAPGTWFNVGLSGDRTKRGFTARHTASSGNNAFDDYRTETLRRLEDEEREFQAFLDRLRQARDKSEFDTFMAERRQRPTHVDDLARTPV